VTCPSCSADVPPGQKFCGECGGRVVIACPSCEATSPAGQKFCGECGTPLGDAAPAAHTAAPEPATAPVASTEHRLVSVLFLDLAGFTPFTEANDAEDVRAFISRYFDHSKEIVERFGGVVDKFIGDAVMAIWGAERSEEDDAERAVRAGLELVDMVSKLGAEAGHPEMAARAGIMTGEASVGPGGNDQGLILGDIVNTASRLQSIGEEGDVLVGQSTRDLTDRAVQYSKVGERALKGKEDSVVVYRAERILAERGGVGRADLIEAPFVGRDEELRLLKDQLHAAGREQRARMVSIVGQAGIGKSRLVWEFLKYIDGLVQTIYWHHGRAPSYSDGIAMWSLAEMVRGRCGISETEEPEVARAAVAETLGTYLEPEQRAWVEPQLLALLGLADAPGERSEMHAALRHFFERIAGHGIAVLVFEDLHWADAATIDFVEEFIEWSRDFPILLVALSRPDLLESRPEWGTLQRGVVQLHLPPLSDPDMHTLVGSLVPAMDQPARQRIVEPAGGIPLFAVEMVRTLINDGTLVPNDEGAFDLTGSVDELSVPDSINAVIGARLDRLSKEDRHLVQDASVLGQTFTADALAATTTLSPEVVEERLSSLVRREMFELIRDPRSPERGQYGFVQSLIREVAHSRIPKDVRRERHLRVAEFFESLDSEEVAGVIAFHYLEAVDAGATDVIPMAVGAVRAAIERARSVHGHEQVLIMTNRANGIVDDPATLAPLWEEAAVAALASGAYELAEEYAQRYVDFAAGSGDQNALARALAVLGEVLNQHGEAKRALQVLGAHFDPDADLPQDEGHARLGMAYSRAMLLAGVEGGHRVAGRALAVAERLDLEEVAAQTLITRGTELWSLGRFREGTALLAKGAEIAEEHGLTATLLRAYANLAYTAPTLAESNVYSNRGFAESRRVGDRSMVQFFAQQGGGYYRGSGRMDELLAMFEDPVIMAADPSLLVSLWHSLANGHSMRGEWEEEAVAWEHAVGLSKQTDDRQAEEFFTSAQIQRALDKMDFDSMFELLDRHAEHFGNPWLKVFTAFMPLLGSGDPAARQRFLDLTQDLPSQGAISPFRRVAVGIDAIASGDVAGGLAFAREAIEEMREGETYEFTARSLAMVAHALGDHPEAPAMIDDARALAESIEARTLLLHIDLVVSGEFPAP
jgi:class 3 adenylate cyclase/tetratricopeptide (TPR) repeat protein